MLYTGHPYFDKSLEEDDKIKERISELVYIVKMVWLKQDNKGVADSSSVATRVSQYQQFKGDFMQKGYSNDEAKCCSKAICTVVF